MAGHHEQIGDGAIAPEADLKSKHTFVNMFPTSGALADSRMMGMAPKCRRAMIEFAGQLSALLDARVPLARALMLLQGEPGKLQSPLADIGRNIAAGAPFSAALAEHPDCFDRVFISVVRAGEAGGTLAKVLRTHTQYMEKARRLQDRVRLAIIHALVMFLLPTFIFAAILMYCVPAYRDVFSDFKTSLPTLTEDVLAVSAFLVAGGWTLVVGAPLLAALAIFLLRGFPAGRLGIDAALFHLSSMTPLARVSAWARYTRTLGTLLGSTVPMLEALSLAREVVGNAALWVILGQVDRGVVRGEQLSTSLRAAGVGDRMLANMVEMGESAGDLSRVLLRVADQYEEEMDLKIEEMMNLLQPLMVVALGAGTGLMVIILFLPFCRGTFSVSGA